MTFPESQNTSEIMSKSFIIKKMYKNIGTVRSGELQNTTAAWRGVCQSGLNKQVNILVKYKFKIFLDCVAQMSIMERILCQ